MNFTKIIQQMNELNRKQQQLKIKYKKKAKTCNIKRNACKFSEDQDDLRIYGYTNQDIVEHFRQQKQPIQSAIQKTAPRTTYNCKPKSSTVACRSKTAKTKCRTKNSNLYSEIEQPNYRSNNSVAPNSTNISHQQKDNQYFSLFAEKNKESRNQEIRKKSIKRYKHKFKKGFQANIKIAEYIRTTESRTIAPNKATFYPPPHRYSLQNIQSKENFFSLTQSKNSQKQLAHYLTQMASADKNKTLHEISIVMTDESDRLYEKLVLKHKNLDNDQLWEHISRLNGMVCLVIDIKNFNVIELRSQKILWTGRILNKLIREKKTLAVYLIEEKEEKGQKKYEKKYDEFIIGDRISIRKIPGIFFQILKYYFCMFLLMDPKNHSFDTALKTTSMFLTRLRKIPKGFEKFIDDMRNKQVKIRNNQQVKKYRLYELMEQGVKKLEKQETKMMEKACLMENDEKHKQQHFYICSLLFNKIQIQYIHYQHFPPKPTKIRYNTIDTSFCKKIAVVLAYESICRHELLMGLQFQYKKKINKIK